MPDDVSSRILAAANLADQRAEQWQKAITEEPSHKRITNGAGPSHWGAVAELLRGMARVHADGHECPSGDRFTGYYEADSEIGLVPCPTVAALLPLVDQIFRDLGR